MSSKKKTGNKQPKQHQKESKKQNSGGFPIKTLFFLTFFVLCGVIYSDIQNHGSWKDSNTAHLLKRCHVCEYSHKVLNKTSESIRWVNSEIDKQFPGYERKLHETLEPYSELISDLGILSYNIVGNAKEAIAIKIEEYAPGLLDKTGEVIKSTLITLHETTNNSLKYLKEEVFVGNLSPEKLADTVMHILISAQQKANECYVWAYDKVRTVIK